MLDKVMKVNHWSHKAIGLGDEKDRRLERARARFCNNVGIKHALDCDIQTRVAF